MNSLSLTIMNSRKKISDASSARFHHLGAYRARTCDPYHVREVIHEEVAHRPPGETLQDPAKLEMEMQWIR
jgi:hypothetical protein